jgi:hypothetical protein
MTSEREHMQIPFPQEQQPPPPVGQGILIIEAALSSSGTQH